MGHIWSCVPFINFITTYNHPEQNLVIHQRQQHVNMLTFNYMKYWIKTVHCFSIFLWNKKNVFVIYTLFIYSKLAVLFAEETIPTGWHHVPAGKCAGPVHSKMWFIYVVVQSKWTDRIKVFWHLGSVMEEPVVPNFCSLDPHINCRTVGYRN